MPVVDSTGLVDPPHAVIDGVCWASTVLVEASAFSDSLRLVVTGSDWCTFVSRPIPAEKTLTTSEDFTAAVAEPAPTCAEVVGIVSSEHESGSAPHTRYVTDMTLKGWEMGRDEWTPPPPRSSF